MRTIHVTLLAVLFSTSYSQLYQRHVDESTIECIQAEFAVRLLRYATSDADSALVLSPFSVGIVLAVASAGANTTTQQQINDALASGFNQNQIQEYFICQEKRLHNESNEAVLRLANLVVMGQHDGFDLNKEFVHRTTNHYATQIKITDCSNISAVITEINDWAENATESHIDRIANEADILPDARLLLVSTVHFEAEWAKKFKYEETFPKEFYVNKDKTKQVNMMPIWAFGSFRYTEDAYVQLLGIPYNDNETFMYLFLPRDRDGLENVVNNITGKRILSLIARCRIVDVEVEIPAFRIENSFDMKDALIKMGVHDAFAPNADFSAISQSDLFISNVLHKAFIEVSENGTEAAEIRKPNHRPLQRMLWQGGHVKFIADHPFLFAIVRDVVILFIGRFT